MLDFPYYSYEKRCVFGYNGTLLSDVSHVLVTGYLYSTEDEDFHVSLSDSVTRRFVTEIPPTLRVIGVTSINAQRVAS